MQVKVFRDRKVAGVYDTKTKTIATKDPLLLKHATEGVTLLGPGDSDSDTDADAPTFYAPDHERFYPAFLNRLGLDGYTVDDNGIEELKRYA